MPTDDVLEREEFEAAMGQLISDIEAEKKRSMGAHKIARHDAALRERVEELEKAVAYIPFWGRVEKQLRMNERQGYAPEGCADVLQRARQALEEAE